MHEHEAPEAAERRKPRTEAGGGAGGPGLLALQQQAGNRAVAGVVARAVEIDEMTSSFDVRDEAKMTPEVQEEVGNAVHAGAGAGGGGGAGTTEEQPATGGGAETLPPGGHATMEEEPS
jgi:hypothetical protein